MRLSGTNSKNTFANTISLKTVTSKHLEWTRKKKRKIYSRQLVNETPPYFSKTKTSSANRHGPALAPQIEIIQEISKLNPAVHC